MVYATLWYLKHKNVIMTSLFFKMDSDNIMLLITTELTEVLQKRYKKIMLQTKTWDEVYNRRWSFD
jgi:hypothetical protein